MILSLKKTDLKKITSRISKRYKIDNIKNINPPLYPLRYLFEKAEIYIPSDNNGTRLIYSKNKTKLFKEYLHKHMFKDYYIELAIENAYKKYINIQKEKVIFQCAIDNNLKCMNEYIQYGFNLNIQEEGKLTLLIYASLYNNYKMVKLLLDNGANPNLNPKYQENAYLIAERKGYIK